MKSFFYQLSKTGLSNCNAKAMPIIVAIAMYNGGDGDEEVWSFAVFFEG